MDRAAILSYPSPTQMLVVALKFIYSILPLILVNVGVFLLEIMDRGAILSYPTPT
jgi:hypothetical protein